MSIKDEVLDFLRLYSELTDSKIRESDDLIHIELSPVEKKKHLLSQIKFSFSRDVCDKENAEFLSVGSPAYEKILNEAKNIGVISVAKSNDITKPSIVVNYLLNLKCQNHIKEDIRSVTVGIEEDIEDISIVNWSETDLTAAVDFDYSIPDITKRIRDAIDIDIKELTFHFEDEMTRRKDRERVVLTEFYNQLQKERNNAEININDEIESLELKMNNTKSMKVYNTCKKQINDFEKKKINLSKTKIKDIYTIKGEFEQNLSRLEDRYAISTGITMLNGLIVLPANPSEFGEPDI